MAVLNTSELVIPEWNTKIEIITPQTAVAAVGAINGGWIIRVSPFFHFWHEFVDDCFSQDCVPENQFFLAPKTCPFNLHTLRTLYNQ